MAGCTALAASVLGGQTEIVDLLINSGTNVNAVIGKYRSGVARGGVDLATWKWGAVQKYATLPNHNASPLFLSIFGFRVCVFLYL